MHSQEMLSCWSRGLGREQCAGSMKTGNRMEGRREGSKRLLLAQGQVRGTQDRDGRILGTAEVTGLQADRREPRKVPEGGVPENGSQSCYSKEKLQRSGHLDGSHGGGHPYLATLKFQIRAQKGPLEQPRRRAEDRVAQNLSQRSGRRGRASR